jgi:hypothetical protein
VRVCASVCVCASLPLCLCLFSSVSPCLLGLCACDYWCDGALISVATHIHRERERVRAGSILQPRPKVPPLMHAHPHHPTPQSEWKTLQFMSEPEMECQVKVTFLQVGLLVSLSCTHYRMSGNSTPTATTQEWQFHHYLVVSLLPPRTTHLHHHLL